MAQKKGHHTGRFNAMVIDEDKCHADATSRMLSELDFCATVYTSPKKALSFLENHAEGVDLVLAEVHMEEMNGFEFLAVARELHKSIQVIMMTTEATMDTMKRCVELGARFLVKKPIDDGTVKNLWQHLDLDVLRREKIKDLLQGAGDKSNNTQETENFDEYWKDGTDQKHSLTWTPDLQKKFLRALQILGEDASPKKIKTIMDVDNINRKQIAAHLQKHRLRLKRELNKASFTKESSKGASNSREPAKSNTRSSTKTQSHPRTQPAKRTMQILHRETKTDDVCAAMRRAMQLGTVFDESKYLISGPCGDEEDEAEEDVFGGDCCADEANAATHSSYADLVAAVAESSDADASQEILSKTTDDSQKTTRGRKAAAFSLVDYSDSDSESDETEASASC